MTCKSCKYKFTLNPKQAPYLTDYAVKRAVDTITSGGKYYFTFNQLYGAVYGAVRGKAATKRRGITLALGILTIVLSVIIGSMIRWWALPIACGLVGAVVWNH
ncbi:MAG: hypothetical protein V2B18_02335, partial [Pseudomonadota bacterium]